MTAPRETDRLIRAFLHEGGTELPDRAFDAVRRDIHRTRQRVVIGPWREPDMSNLARVAIAARLPEPLSPGSREAWRALARRLVSATIAAAQAEARIESLRKSERLQQALYEIADLAGSGLEMEEMLKRIHGVVGGLMSAANFYIVLYDDVRATLRFLYFADQLDPWVAHPEVETPVAEMPNSLTVALLRVADQLEPMLRRVEPPPGAAKLKRLCDSPDFSSAGLGARQIEGLWRELEDAHRDGRRLF